MRTIGARAGAASGWDRWRAVVPGWPQWRRGQRGRALVLLGSYLSAMAVGLFAWGTLAGAALLGFAVVAHWASVADAIRQAAFPGVGPWAPWFSAAVGVGGGGYAPALVVALNVAFPVWTPGGGYLVDRSAFDGRGPEAGQWVWLEREGPGRPREVARVVAGGGRRVSWAEGEVRVDGRKADMPIEAIDPSRRSRGEFIVPDGALLVCSPDGGPIGRDPGRSAGGPLSLVAADRAIGRPWATYFPIWRRRLLI